MGKVKTVDLFLPQWTGRNGENESCDVYFLNATEAYADTVRTVGKCAVYPLCKQAVRIDGVYYLLSEIIVTVNPFEKVMSAAAKFGKEMARIVQPSFLDDIFKSRELSFIKFSDGKRGLNLD